MQKLDLLRCKTDIIIAVVPNNTAHNLAQRVNMYLILYRRINNDGAEVVFSGTKVWPIQSNGRSQDIITRLAIHTGLHREISAG
ncbi:hypothetical protein BDV38DRAFT_245919 [Aspergillus pseudotamarii]|uniref:PRISE-like Rossmann-fold domain-containing protein n=1 Tax=Aspergillus pseudotamarii TaxID=132259 RepID=A0A5N6SVM1_ASPPS|nr:uncharacterized protein BDV38DRAFT_245919 [Aspergillus pseudotamarii]KAE8137937.1 hypothetical protein BDV38DRAFT_245919 [Aspergillus pseudotamarii]